MRNKKIKKLSSGLFGAMIFAPAIFSMSYAPKTITGAKGMPSDWAVTTASYVPNQTPTDYTSPISDSVSLKKIFGTVTINNLAADAVQTLVDNMKSDPDYSWNSTGIPMLDAFNVVRYAIKASASGNYEPRSWLAIFAHNVFPTKFVYDTTKTYQTAARQTINNWLDGATDIPLISSAMATDWQDHPVSKDDLAKTEALRISVDSMRFMQYRTNQIEWRGSFDSHSWKTTNTEIQNSPAAKGNVSAPNIVAPALLATGASTTESFVNNFIASPTSDSRAISPLASETNIYTGIAVALSILYDDNDSSSTAGHRKNLFFPTYDNVGWSKVITNLNSAKPSAYLFLATSDATAYSIHTAANDAAIKNSMAWIQNIWGEDTVNYLIANNISELPFIKHVLSVIPNMNMASLNTTLTNTRNIVATNPSDWFTKAIATIKSAGWYGSTIWQGTSASNVAPTTINNYDLNKLASITQYPKIAYSNFDEMKSKGFDLLGTDTMITHIEGAAPNSVIEDLLMGMPK